MQRLAIAAILSLLAVSAGHMVPAQAQSDHPASRGLSLQTPGATPPLGAPDCGAGSAVWISDGRPPTYVLPGDRFYGKGSAGRYMCRHEADMAGIKMTRSAP